MNLSNKICNKCKRPVREAIKEYIEWLNSGASLSYTRNMAKLIDVFGEELTK